MWRWRQCNGYDSSHICEKKLFSKLSKSVTFSSFLSLSLSVLLFLLSFSLSRSLFLYLSLSITYIIIHLLKSFATPHQSKLYNSHLCHFVMLIAHLIRSHFLKSKFQLLCDIQTVSEKKYLFYILFLLF